MGFKQKMYAISLRHFSPMQKGIQSNHAIIEYSNEYFNTPKYTQWSRIDKYDILLEINTSDDLMHLIKTLKEFNHPHMVFREPDVFDIITSVAFLLDESVWDEEKYPRCLNEKVKVFRELVMPLRLAS